MLVIEDHPTNQAMMAWRLQQLGVPHVLLGDGQQALDRLSSEAFDLVITDCRMPVLDGFGFTRLLREREGRTGQPRLTVLALTASVLDDDARRCREPAWTRCWPSRCRWPRCAPRCCAGCRRLGQSFDAPVQETVADDAEVLPDLATLQQRYGSRAVAEQLRGLLQASESDLAAVQRAVRAGDRETAALHLHRQAGGLGRSGQAHWPGRPTRWSSACRMRPRPIRHRCSPL